MREEVEAFSPFLVLPTRPREIARRRTDGFVYPGVWLKADQVGAPIVSGAALTRWADAQGGGPAVAVATPPTWQANQQNGLPAVLFTASPLVLDRAEPLPELPSDPWSVAWVATLTAGNSQLWSHFTAGGSVSRGVLVSPSPTGLNTNLYGFGLDGRASLIGSLVSLTLSVWHVGIVTYDGSGRSGSQSMSAWFNGVPQVLAASDSALPLPTDQVPPTFPRPRGVVGGVFQGSVTPGGTFALGELIVVRRQLTPADAVQLSATLKAKWGTP